MGDVGRFQRSPPAEGDDPPPRERRPLATSAVGDDAGKKKRRSWLHDDDTVEKTVWIALVEKRRQAIVEEHFDVSWFDLDYDARANLFYYLVDRGEVAAYDAIDLDYDALFDYDAAPETKEEGCMSPPSPADSEATLHLPTPDSTLAAPCGKGYDDGTRKNDKAVGRGGTQSVE